MCGIVGYIGNDNAIDKVMGGLASLEYRGYDSSGIAFADENSFNIVKRVGRLAELSSALCDAPINAKLAIGHTRWATHGAPSEVNAHPHFNKDKTIAVVHNGIIENYQQIKTDLINEGYEFISQTDTEVVAALIDSFYDGDFYDACKRAFAMLEGSYAIAAVAEFSDEIIATRKNSPLVLGVGEGEFMLASDIPAMLATMRDFIYLENGDIVRLMRGSYVIENGGIEIKREKKYIDWDIEAAGKDGYEHFMLKEIHQQHRALLDTIGPRVKNGELFLEESGFDISLFSDIDAVYIVACGTAYHAGKTGARFLMRYLDVPVIVDIASEFRYNHPKISERTLVIVVSQSGETADTLAALREAKHYGAKTFAITNVLGSSISRECDNVFYTWAGPELAVASTKAYTTQLAAFYLLSLGIGKARGYIDDTALKAMIDVLNNAVEKISVVVENDEELIKIADTLKSHNDVFYLGRGIDFDLALEASLKLKEISYIHTEGFASGELKHGPIALIEKQTPVITIITDERLAEKSLSNVAEVKARGAYAIGIVADGIAYPDDMFEISVNIPKSEYGLSIFAASAAVQLIAYHAALMCGHDVDKPRNLAKSVTVE